jgi:hypothetical protein
MPEPTSPHPTTLDPVFDRLWAAGIDFEVVFDGPAATCGLCRDLSAAA